MSEDQSGSCGATSADTSPQRRCCCGGRRCCCRAVWRVLKWAYHVSLVCLLLALALEFGLRWTLGLGDPPLYQFDPQIDYLAIPGREYMRFGCLTSYNHYSMRSDYFSPTKRLDGELRVIFIGDSVLNGGAVVDQKDIMTEIVKRELREKLNRPVVVGNISTGGWSPENELAYVKKFGLFDADVVVLWLNSGDADDVTPFAWQNPAFPKVRPTSAICELWERYVPWLDERLVKQSPTSSLPLPPLEQRRKTSLAAVNELLSIAQKSGADVRLVLMPFPFEFEKGESQIEGYGLLRKAAEQQGVAVVDLFDAYREASQSQTLARGLHPNAAGQAFMARAIEPTIEQLLKRRMDQSAAPADGR